MKRLATMVLLALTLSTAVISCREKSETEKTMDEMNDKGADVKVKDGGDKVKMETDDEKVKIKTDDDGTTTIKKKEKDTTDN